MAHTVYLLFHQLQKGQSQLSFGQTRILQDIVLSMLLEECYMPRHFLVYRLKTLSWNTKLYTHCDNRETLNYCLVILWWPLTCKKEEGRVGGGERERARQ